MKSRFLSLMFATAICGSITLSSCKKSNEALLDEYSNVATEYVKAAKADDATKVKELNERLEKTGNELKERDLTDSERDRFLEINVEIAMELFGDDIDSIEI